MAGNHGRRLAKVEHGLTPTQAVLRWMQEALQHPSLQDLARSYVGKPSADYPLSVLPSQVAAAVRAAYKGEKREVVATAVERAERDVVFLWKLFMHANGSVLEEQRPFALAELLLQEKLQRLTERLLLHHQMVTAWSQASERLPYPLDQETARAVRAAIDHYVEPWDVFDESGVVQDWVTQEYEAAGKTALPFWSSFARTDRPAPLGVAVPTLEELRALFRDEAQFEQWRAGEDFQYGLAHVRDAELEGRCAAVDAAVRALVGQGVVQEGWVVHLPTVPMGLLQTAPLVDGLWVDAHVVELAECGALLQKKGVVFRDAEDNSPFAWERMGRATKDGFAAADEGTLWDQRAVARSRLGSYLGRTREVDGRRYLHLDDYAAWRGRALRGKLVREPGVVAASWNTWRETQTPSAGLAGVPVGPLTCWAAPAPYSVHDEEEARKLVRERARLLGHLRAWTLHDFDRAPPYFSRPSPLNGRSFREEATEWRNLALVFGREVFALREALQRVAERYFEGHPVLFDEEYSDLLEQCDLWREMLSAFNELVVAEIERAGGEKPGVSRLGLDAVMDLGRAVAPDRAAYLVDLAKADALRLLGESNAAADLLERHLVGDAAGNGME